MAEESHESFNEFTKETGASEDAVCDDITGKAAADGSPTRTTKTPAAPLTIGLPSVK